jgi:hypothetical protein
VLDRHDHRMGCTSRGSAWFLRGQVCEGRREGNEEGKGAGNDQTQGVLRGRLGRISCCFA